MCVIGPSRTSGIPRAWPLLTLLLPVLLLAGCVQATPLPWSDGFSDPASGWLAESDATAEVSYHDGVMRILVKAPDSLAWASAGRAFGDFHLTVEATQVGGPDDNEYGVLVTRVDAISRFYVLVSSVVMGVMALAGAVVALRLEGRTYIVLGVIVILSAVVGLGVSQERQGLFVLAPCVAVLILALGVLAGALISLARARERDVRRLCVLGASVLIALLAVFTLLRLLRLEGDDPIYCFSISGDGYQQVRRYDGDTWETLGPEWAKSEAIRMGEATNRLEIVCRGGQMSFLVNGVQVAQVEDPDYLRGDIGLYAGSFSEPGVEIHFDDVRVTPP